MNPIEKEIHDNALLTRDDMAVLLLSLLKPVEERLVQGGSGFEVGFSGTQYSPRVALFEGWSRLLWGVAPLAAGGYEWTAIRNHLGGISQIINPKSEYYQGKLFSFDQKMVEMGALAMALLVAPHMYWDSLDAQDQNSLVAWLLSINEYDMPPNNWRFFRVLVNLAVSERCGKGNVRKMEEELDFLLSLYAADGWYRDGVSFDNYNPFAIHFYSLVYYAFRHGEDRGRCELIKERTQLFARQFLFSFSKDGSHIPYGRSLTYRYAVVSFFSACAFAGIEALPWGVMKGLVLRNLRWWFQQPILDNGGLLTIGYRYPSLIQADEYNAPGSPYWSFKVFLPLALPSDHPFWSSEEAPLPAMPQTVELAVPHELVIHTDNDVFKLVAGQYSRKELNNTAAKYAKFAYSTRYAFSVALSQFTFERTGCDSMLYLSEGDDWWRSRGRVEDAFSCEQYVSSVWYPWKDVRIKTWLIPHQEGHIRIHRIESGRSLETKEGGYALNRFHDYDLPVDMVQEDIGAGQGVALHFPWGTSLISSIGKFVRKASSVLPAPNLNLMFPATVVPILDGKVDKGVTWLSCYVQASSSPCTAPQDIFLDEKQGVCRLGDKEVILTY